MALMSIRSRSRVKASMVLTRSDHLFIQNYIRSFLNNIVRHILSNWSGRGSNPCPTACVSEALASDPYRQLYVPKYVPMSIL